ncbi:RAB6A-GEF complex partner protein 1 [Erysiphe neolycopersici]|uniref:RAB6A-GEF complex partner protein 1 n=1 Tax=Erysiphe neolycopersici TaxID=212602 RepID=A0A420I103_9PEZI|nr:RAB6A-GEF complex partner protein 1 [Erysiphe neolycopersici]
MYWPAGAPRIYTASSNQAKKRQIIEFINEANSFTIVGNNNDCQIDKSEGNLYEKNDDRIEKHKPKIYTAASKTQNLHLSPNNSVRHDIQPPQTSSQPNDENNPSINPDDQSLLSLKISRSGHLFAVISSTSLTVWQTKPTVILAVVVRSEKSLSTYGTNFSLLMRPDSTVLAVLTTNGYLITYSLAMKPDGKAYRPYFPNSSNSHTHSQNKFSDTRYKIGDGMIWGPGEGDGIREINLSFRLVLQVSAGTCQGLALDDELIVSTRQPPSIQCIQWTPGSSGSQTTTSLLSNIEWLPSKSSILDMIHDCPMNLSTWITTDGRAYAVQKLKHPKDTGLSQNMFRGYCFHVPNSLKSFAVKATINARFSLIAVGCVDGTIQIYTAKDYVGNIPPSHNCKAAVSESLTGNLTCLTYSPDGYCLFAGYEKGWAIWSVFGKPGATSFGNDKKISQKQGEAWLEGVKEAAWISGGLEILMISHQDHRIWVLEMARSATCSCYGLANISRTLIQTTSSIAVYRGYDQFDSRALSNESSLWHIAQVPSSYLADQWPIRYSVISFDGRYIAVAGRRGLTHYSVSSRRWKSFADKTMENEFQIRGGMCWHQHILVAAIETENVYQLRLFSREADLNISSVLHTESLPAPVVIIAPSGEDSLLVYTYENILYHYIFVQLSGKLKILQVGQIAFHGIVRFPARVRGLSWILPNDELLQDDPSQEVACASVIFLYDGKLVLLQPIVSEERELRYDMRVIAQNVEYYALMRDIQIPLPPCRKIDFKTPALVEDDTALNNPDENCLSNSLWIFEGNEIKGWLNAKDLLLATSPEIGRELPLMVSIPVDFYPLSILLEKGIILGLEPELIQRRDINFTFFKFSLRNHLFIPHVLQFQLSQFDHAAAINSAKRYQGLNYFAHSLEMLLYNILEQEVDTCSADKNSLLPMVISFLSMFPQYLDIIVQCTRKTEVRSWRTLFKYLPTPQELFNESLRNGSLKTAAGYMIIVQTFGELSTSSELLISLFLRAKNEEDWTLCEELANFLIALDPSGDILSGTMEMLTLNDPIEQDKKIRILLEKIRVQGN